MHELATTFSAVGDPVRLAILERLMQRGEQSAGELLDVAEISAPAVSRHLKVLRQAGLISQRVDAQRRIYAVDRDAIGQIGRWAMSHRAFWEGSLDRLAVALNEKD